MKKHFYCPLSPYILWHHGLIYKECPLNASHREMGACKSCCLNDCKSKKQRKQKSRSKIERRKKEPIPNIGKTYTSK